MPKNTFVEKFTLDGATSELIESVDATTHTWEEMADELCKPLACQTVKDHKDAAS